MSKSVSVSSDLFHHPQEVLLAHFNMYHLLILFICQLKRHNQAKIIIFILAP